MKYLISLALLVVSKNSFAAGGFTWLHGISEQLQLREHTVTFLLTSVIFIIGGLIYRLKTKSVDKSIVPDKGISYRNLVEFIGEFIYGLARNTMGSKDAKTYYPLLIFYFGFIFLNNLIGLIPGFLPPTENFNTGLALGIWIFIYYNAQGIKVQGLWGHIKHFMGPMIYMAPLIFVLEIISHAMRPLTLGLRIRGNMLGDHTVLAIFSDLVPYVVPLPFYCLGIFVCFMQAFVFTLLTMIYISMAVETHDHEEHAH
ncbi:MAG: F0F1 ATP synthase subunit A [Bacteriovoracaceae bacterium]|jgi:F-type H+-transporting ATPase subunit a|nr:F0F1 ATP synthase subunit A [Bacteriovoracaceae bacterium]